MSFIGEPSNIEQGLELLNHTMNLDFIEKELKFLLNRNQCDHIFRDRFLGNNDDMEKLNKEMNSQISYKFQTQCIDLTKTRLNLFAKIKCLQGPQYIVCLLENMKKVKQTLVLNMEQGMECKIPDELLSSKLPQSFQYYDAIINITQNLVSEEKREFLNMQTSLIRYFDK